MLHLGVTSTTMLTADQHLKTELYKSSLDVFVIALRRPHAKVLLKLNLN